MSDTIVFIPAWNEEQNLPAVLDELARDLPDADVVVVDDGSTDGTAAVARERGAEVVSFDRNRGLREAIAAGYDYARDRGYAYCGRVDADGQHPVHELRRLLDLVRSGECDVAIGSTVRLGRRLRAVSVPAGHGALVRHRRCSGAPSRCGSAARSWTRPAACTRPTRARSRCSPSRTRAARPEVESLLRLADEGLVVEEVPVNMRERASGESKLTGKKAVALVATVVGTLLLYRKLRAR